MKWLISYLEDRQQRISINGTYSRFFPLPWGVPQGSVIGPLEYILYTGPLTNIIAGHEGIRHAVYADDTQIYVVVKQGEHADAVDKLQSCIADVRRWSSNHQLKLNGAKTEVIHITSQFRKATPPSPLDVGDDSICPADAVRNLGVTLDNKLTMKQHIRYTCRAAGFGISKIGKIRKYLTTRMLKDWCTLSSRPTWITATVC